MAKSAEQRFWLNVNKGGGCWLWSAATDRDGYGYFYFDGKQGKAHRFSYILHHGPIPEGLWVLHHCDTPGCVNPDHLYAGTSAQNIQDAIERNRLPTGDRNGSRLHPEMRPRGQKHWTKQVGQMPTSGEGNGRAKLTEADVIAIRELYAKGTHSQSQVGKLFGVSQARINSIVTRRTWKHLKGSTNA